MKIVKNPILYLLSDSTTKSFIHLYINFVPSPSSSLTFQHSLWIIPSATRPRSFLSIQQQQQQKRNEGPSTPTRSSITPSPPKQTWRIKFATKAPLLAFFLYPAPLMIACQFIVIIVVAELRAAQWNFASLCANALEMLWLHSNNPLLSQNYNLFEQLLRARKVESEMLMSGVDEKG